MPELNVLKCQHIMIAPFEKHDILPTFPPGAPVLPSQWHVAGPAPLKWGPWGGLTGRSAPDVQHDNDQTILRSSDIGPLIPHIGVTPPAFPFHYFLPLIILTSGSKSHFCAPRDLAAGQPKAVALLRVVGINLNCCGATWPPLPTGVVAAFYSTRTTNVSWGELFRGFLHMLADALIQFLINRAFGRLGNSKYSERILNATFGRLARTNAWASVFGGKTAGGAVAGLIDDMFMRLIPAAGRPGPIGRLTGDIARTIGYGVVDQAPGIISGLLTGTPLGWAPGWAPIGKPQEDGSREKVSPVGYGSDLLGDLINPAQPETHPSQAPAPTPAPSPAPTPAPSPAPTPAPSG